jgi:hypothetical protein
MPLHMPHIGKHKHDHHHRASHPEPESYIPTSASRSGTGTAPSSPGSPSITLPPTSPRDTNGGSTSHPAARRTSTMTSSTSSSSNAPPSILKKIDSASTSDYTNSSSSASAFLSKRFSNLGLNRTDTISSYQSDDDRDDASSPSTPATSVSSLSNQCPLPATLTAGQRFPFFMMTLSSTSTLSFIALPLAMRPIVLDAVTRAWKRGLAKTSQVEYQPELMKRHKDKGCEGGVWEITLKDNAWMPESKDKVS